MFLLLTVSMCVCHNSLKDESVSQSGTDHEDSDPMFTVAEGAFIESNFTLD